jgi:hypothetical protein
MAIAVELVAVHRAALAKAGETEMSRSDMAIGNSLIAVLRRWRRMSCRATSATFISRVSPRGKALPATCFEAFAAGGATPRQRVRRAEPTRRVLWRKSHMHRILPMRRLQRETVPQVSA